MAEPSEYLVHELAAGVELWLVPVDELVEQDLNARVMPGAMFDRLQANIDERGALVESLPYCHVDEEGRVAIISGHHRVRAARAALVHEIHCLVDTNPMTHSEVVAKQLAHNALSGEDDSQMLRILIAQMSTTHDLLESFIGSNIPDAEQAPIELSPMAQIMFDFKTIVFTFLPSQLDDLTALVDSVGTADFLGLIDKSQYEDFRDALTAFQKVKDVRSMGTSIHLMVRAAQEIVEASERAVEPDEAVAASKRSS